MVTLGRIIEETSPPKYLGAFGVFTNLASTCGNMVALLMAIGLPPEDDKQALKDSNY